MTFYGAQQPVLTPALEGSKAIVPMNARFPPGMYRPHTNFDPKGQYPMGVFGSSLPPIGGRYMNYMPAERVSVPTLMPPRRRYMGPPSVLPWWGGYSMQGRYYPERTAVPVPVRAPMNFPPQLPAYRQPPAPPKKSVKKNLQQFSSGSGALKRFRQVAIATSFIAHLKARTNAKLKNVTTRPNSMFLFGIILKEIVAALHRIYLNPSGNIYPVLNDVIGPNSYDLSSLVHGGQYNESEEKVLLQELQYVIENLIYHITEIMPASGVLGTHRKSAVFELIRGGKRFPDGYFWQVEMDHLQFTENGRTVNVGDTESFLLILGIFISRSLVTTILMKPLDYGLSSQPLSDIADRNLRIIASAILFLIRRISIARGRGIMEMPSEVAKYLYSDAEMDHVYSKLSRTFNYCEGLLREWGTEYVRRLRSSST